MLRLVEREAARFEANGIQMMITKIKLKPNKPIGADNSGFYSIYYVYDSTDLGMKLVKVKNPNYEIILKSQSHNFENQLQFSLHQAQ